MRNPLEVIEDIQQKSENVRRSIAVVSVISIMAIVVGIWLTTFSLPSSSLTASADMTDDAPSPFALFWNFIKESVK